MKVIAAVVCVVALVVAAFFLKDRIADKQPQRLATTLVTKSSHVRTVPAEGTLKAAKATPIQVPRSSTRRLRIAWLKKDGATVKEGEVVVRFDREEFKQNLANGRDDQKSTQFKLTAERSRSEESMRTRKRSAEVARQDLKIATDRRTDEDDEIFSRNELLTSNIDRKLSEAKVEHADATNRMDRSLSRSKIKLLELEQKAAELAIERANDGLSRMEIKAPHDGIFVYESTRIKVGAQVYRGQTIANLPLVATMEAEVFVLEADVKGLVEGGEATLFIESQPSVQYNATIKKINTLAQPRHNEVPIQYFTITLELERTDTNSMKPGQRVRAQLGLDPLEGLVLPRQCVFQIDGDMVVFRQSGDSFDTVNVKLGAGTPGLVVIEEGLASGDRVATRDPFGTSDVEKDDDNSADDSEKSP